LTLLAQGLKTRDHNGEQLDDDACRDVRHDPEREDAQLQQRSTTEQVDQPVEGVALHQGQTGLDRGVVNARGRDDGTHAVDRDQAEGEQDLVAKVRGAERRSELR
jgi:hypothetical protein